MIRAAAGNIEGKEMDTSTTTLEASSSSLPSSSSFSSSLPSSSSSSTDEMYDVFLSFRGEDMRKTFTDHLCCNLEDAGVDVFIYEDELEREQSMPDKVKQAIQLSRMSVIVFSSTYADSVWCLDELLKIMECRTTLGQWVLSVFCDVDPSDVKKRSGSFAQAFQKHEERYSRERVHQWRIALTEAADLFRHYEVFRKTDGDEGMFIKNLVDEITRILKSTYLDVAIHPVGIDRRAQEISNYLDVGGSDDVRIIGIWGMGGIGKTAVAKAIFNKYHHSFDGKSFIQDGRGRESKTVFDLRKLLSDISEPTKVEVSGVDEGTEKIKKRSVGRIKVLVIVDDIMEPAAETLNALAIKHGTLGRGSRIIITTRDKCLLEKCGVDKICLLQALNKEEALELFSWHAFRNRYPNHEGYLKRSRLIVDYCGGLPLALAGLGSYLHGRSRAQWKSKFNELTELAGRKVHNALKQSYDLLPLGVKAVFLDIACFFIGMDEKYVSQILNLEKKSLLTSEQNMPMMHRFPPDICRAIVAARVLNKPGGDGVLNKPGGDGDIRTILEKIGLLSSEQNMAMMRRFPLYMGGEIVEAKSPNNLGGDIRTLLEKSLLTVEENKLMMHCLHRDMGREIVQAKSPANPGKRSRLWQHEDVKHVLRSESGTKEIEGLAIDLQNSDEPSFSTEAFRMMQGLRLLKLNYVKLTGSYKHLSKKLRWLCWHGFPLEVIPEDFNQENLVVIDLSYSKLIRVWEDSFVLLEMLRILDLSHSASLAESPDFSKLPNLEQLILRGCKSLSEVHHSVVRLRRIELLDLGECNLADGVLPEDFGDLCSVRHLLLDGNGFSRLPVLSDLRKLLKLSLNNCKNLEEIPTLPISLEILEANHCTVLETMANFSDSWAMRELHLTDCHKLNWIAGITYYSMQTVHLEGCTNLPDGFRGILESERMSSIRGDLFLSGNDINIPGWFTAVVDKDDLIHFKVPERSRYNIQALTVCVVYSADDSQSIGSLCLRIANRTQRTQFCMRRMNAVTARSCPDDYLWLGNISNKELNLKGGDKIIVDAKFLGEQDIDHQFRVKKKGVYLPDFYDYEHGKIDCVSEPYAYPDTDDDEWTNICPSTL